VWFLVSSIRFTTMRSARRAGDRGRPRAPDQAGIDEPSHTTDTELWWVSVRAASSLGQRAAGGAELLQHEQLRRRQPGALLRLAGRLAQELDDPADGVEHRAGIGRCMGSHGFGPV